MKIKLLSNETINLIAAGEVVERPLNIVKELLENSIDAGAVSLTVEIKNGGTELIRITDNGYGMDKEDIPMAFLRHATSKIKDSKDLTSIHSLGFRGEALASIAAVSEVELISKKPGSLLGAYYKIAYGNELDFRDIGAADGTTVIVRDLFAKIPARKKFLKSAKTESAKIQDILEKEAIAHPEISFKFIRDGKQIIATLGNNLLKDSIYSIYGREVSSLLIPVHRSFDRSPLSGIPFINIRGLVGKPELNRANRNYEIYFVNGRYVKDDIIKKAIEDAYSSFLMQHRFPFTVLCLDLNPEIVDVNVHPQKMEVRFSDGKRIYECVYESVREAIRSIELIPEIKEDVDPVKEDDPIIPEPFEKEARKEFYKEFIRENISSDEELLSKENKEDSNSPYVYKETKETKKINSFDKIDTENNYKDKSLNINKTHNRDEKPLASKLYEAEKEKPKINYAALMEKGSLKQESLFDNKKFLSKEARFDHRIIGQVFKTYWLIEYGDNLYIMDQHAAHEKVNFERLMKKYKEGNKASQNLMPPILLSLSSEESILLNKYMENFERLGYMISYLGGNDFSVSAIPSDLPEIGKRDVLMEMIDSLMDETVPLDPESIYSKLASMSCKAAVKGENYLSFMEADALITELLSLDNPYNCPHGRPVLIKMSKKELEKKFKRII